MTKLTDATQTFNRPRFQQQGPDGNCRITVGDRTYNLGWDSCTMYAGAMAVDGSTGGRQRPSGCALRRASGDVSGGTTLRQMADAVMKLTGIYVDVHTGANVLTPQRVARNARAGRRQVIQINADAMLGTKYQSTAGPVNHAVMVNEVRGGTLDEPDEALIYDPAADGRQRTYHVDQGPSWWPWWLVKRACANLRPSGPGGSRLGPGKVYVGVFPDSEPHVTLRTGAVRSKPFPDRTRAAEDTVRVRSQPFTDAPVLYKVGKGALLVGYQYVHGDEHEGSTLWLGNDDANEFVHVKNLSHVGGTT
jgi:hypothetical protein